MSKSTRTSMSPIFRSGRLRLDRAFRDALHPWRYVTGALGSSPLGGQAKRAVSRLLYEYLARKYPQVEWTTMNYGYAVLPTKEGSTLAPIDASERFPLQLYRHVATLGSHCDTFAGLDVLEIGSGRGGGAAYIASSLAPETMVALDLSASATELARTRHQRDGMPNYVQGDAENLRLEAASFDVVLNVESAHCYGSMARFLTEVHRVLRPGGELLFADFASRRNGALERMHGALSGGPLRLTMVQDITANVVRALELDEVRKRELIERSVRGLFKTFARGAYAMEGTTMRVELESDHTVYLAAVLRKDRFD